MSPPGATLVIAGDRLAYSGPPGRFAWVIKLNEHSQPRVFDREWVVPESFLQECWRGVYSLDGDTLTICSVRAWSEESRPTDLSGKEPGQIVEVFQRKKP